MHQQVGATFLFTGALNVVMLFDMDSVSVRMDEFLGTFLLIINGLDVLKGNFLASVPIGFILTVVIFATGGAGAPPRSVTGRSCQPCIGFLSVPLSL